MLSNIYCALLATLLVVVCVCVGVFLCFKVFNMLFSVPSPSGYEKLLYFTFTLMGVFF